MAHKAFNKRVEWINKAEIPAMELQIKLLKEQKDNLFPIIPPQTTKGIPQYVAKVNKSKRLDESIQRAESVLRYHQSVGKLVSNWAKEEQQTHFIPRLQKIVKKITGK